MTPASARSQHRQPPGALEGVERDEPERIADTLVEMVKTRIPAKFRLDPIRDVQVLCPMNRGSLGIRELNARLQAELNPAKPEEPFLEKFGWQFRVRDMVIQTENDYDVKQVPASRALTATRSATALAIGSAKS